MAQDHLEGEAKRFVEINRPISTREFALPWIKAGRRWVGQSNPAIDRSYVW
jgi:hypothetical protein